ncbi:sperm axonemal maintenance protein CFAP97D1 isoform X2 [Dendrobates tinctorius]|uniref:sperm axonemal maintenance protein CFAP97D1 isoform X2 n=1 Tax=Dendrobates tinctorius TaxID=92724 RepID=UPI003CC9D88C
MNTVDYLAFPLIVANHRQNNILKKKWDNYHYQCHVSRVRAVKPEVDNKPPRTFLHHHVQAKKIQKEQERLAEIEKNNRLLMEKIALIMRTGGTVDNWNTCVLRSINSNKRNREIVRITAENQAIHKKILDSKPYYDHKKWECEWKATRKLMQHTSSYCALTKNKWMASKFAVT